MPFGNQKLPASKGEAPVDGAPTPALLLPHSACHAQDWLHSDLRVDCMRYRSRCICANV